MILTRPAREDERQFVISYWVKGFVDGPSSGPIPMGMVFEVWRKVVEHVLGRPGVKVLVAYHEAVPDVLLGFAVTEDGFPWPCLHYCFVKKDFRQRGIARQLLADSGLDYRSCEEFYVTFETDFIRSHLVRGARWPGRVSRFIIRESKDEYLRRILRRDRHRKRPAKTQASKGG